MDRIFEHANEQHLRALIVYGNTEDGILYYEPDHVNKADVNDVENAYKKDALRIDDGTNLLAPICMAGRMVLTIDGAPGTGRMTGWVASEGELASSRPPALGISFVNPLFEKA